MSTIQVSIWEYIAILGTAMLDGSGIAGRRPPERLLLHLGKAGSSLDSHLLPNDRGMHRKAFQLSLRDPCRYIVLQKIQQFPTRIPVRADWVAGPHTLTANISDFC